MATLFVPFLYLKYQNNQIDHVNNISSFMYYSLSAMVPENRCCMSGLWDVTVRKRFNLIRKYYVFADILCRRSLWKASIQIFPLMIDQPLTPPTHLRAVWHHQQCRMKWIGKFLRGMSATWSQNLRMWGSKSCHQWKKCGERNGKRQGKRWKRHQTGSWWNQYLCWSWALGKGEAQAGVEAGEAPPW